MTEDSRLSEFKEVLRPELDSDDGKEMTEKFGGEDECCIRFLRACDHDLNRATQMFHNSLEFRIANEVNNILTKSQEFMEGVSPLFGLAFRGFTIDGSLIQVWKVGELDPNKLQQILNYEQLQEFYLCWMETGLSLQRKGYEMHKNETEETQEKMNENDKINEEINTKNENDYKSIESNNNNNNNTNDENNDNNDNKSAYTNDENNDNKSAYANDENIDNKSAYTNESILNEPITRIEHLRKQKGTIEIYDLSLISLSQLNISFIRTFTSILKIGDLHYPENLRVAFIINAPRFFSFGWKIIRQVLSQNTRDKIFVTSDDSRKQLLDYVSEEQLTQLLLPVRTN